MRVSVCIYMLFIYIYIHTHVHNHSFHSINMATSYYPWINAVKKHIKQFVVYGVNVVMLHKSIKILKENDNCCKDIGYDDMMRRKFRQSYSDYTPKNVRRVEKHTLEIPTLLLLVLPFEASLSDKKWEEKNTTC